jgi:hypothetical protein
VLGGAGDVALGHQRIDDDGQVEIDATTSFTRAAKSWMASLHP